ncbi:MAG: 30S ribosomal protein S9 [Flavobacteriales bacterium AspAUS03]
MEVIHTIGRRKSAIARIYLKEGQGNIKINEQSHKAKKRGRKAKEWGYEEYFPHPIFMDKILQAFVLTNNLDQYDLTIKVFGGGINGQAEAIRLAISRALCELNSENRGILKSEGLLTRDSRKVERKKFGQKKARKQFQFSKR